MDDNKNTKTSIQISVNVRDKLKKYCSENGFKMCAILEKIILKEIENDD